MADQAHVLLRDVTLRDGLQNESVFVPTKIKRILVDRIIACGFRSLEVTSFVRKDRVPALRDADELAQSLPVYPGVEYRALVPNRRGMQRFLAGKTETAVLFLSASPLHNQANVQRTTEESLAEIISLIRLAEENGRRAAGAIATAFVCPYAGVVPYSRLERIAEALAESGVKEMSLADTSGQATPDLVYERCVSIKKQFPMLELSLHLHDAKGYGLRNMLAGIEAGVCTFDVAQGGLGGCPFVPDAPGNLSSRSVLECLAERGIATDLDYKNVCQLEEYVLRIMKRRNE